MNTESPTYEQTRTKGSPGELHDKIQATRSRLDDTVDLLIEQLSLNQLINNMTAKLGFGGDGVGKAKAKETCRRACRTLAQQVRAHPGPTLLLGTGLVWMILEEDEKPMAPRSDEAESRLPSARHDATVLSSRIVPDESYIGSHPRDRSAIEGGPDGGGAGSFSDQLSSAADKVKSAGRSSVESIQGVARATAESTSEWTSSAADRSKQIGHQLAGRVKEGYYAGSRRYDEAMESHPLAVAAGALALGLLGALALPRTRREDELLGEQSDQVMETAKKRGHEAVESAKIIAERARQRAADEAEHAELTAEYARKQGKELAEKAGDVIRGVKEEVEEAAQAEKEKHQHSGPPQEDTPSHGEPSLKTALA